MLLLKEGILDIILSHILLIQSCGLIQYYDLILGSHFWKYIFVFILTNEKILNLFGQITNQQFHYLIFNYIIPH